jgi:hypothetical protein
LPAAAAGAAAIARTDVDDCNDIAIDVVYRAMGRMVIRNIDDAVIDMLGRRVGVWPRC